MKETMIKPIQEKQDQMDERLKHIERGGLVTVAGRGGNGGEGRDENAQSKLRILSCIGKTLVVLLTIYSQSCFKMFFFFFQPFQCVFSVVCVCLCLNM